MTRSVHVAVVRVYRSLSSYGSEPFTVPSGSPKIVPGDAEVLEVHLGDVPPWIKRAEARVRISSEAMLRGTFLNDPIARDQLNVRMSEAKDHVLVEEKHKWLVALVLRWQEEWPKEAVTDEQWSWCATARLMESERAAKRRIASLDLAARVLEKDVPNVLYEIVVADRVYVARDASFADAFGMPNFTLGTPSIGATSTLERVEGALAGTELQKALQNALAAPAVAKDAARPDRFERALRTDLLADDGGSYGRYELLREMQPVLMRASSVRPLSVMFIDMNGLKQINNTYGHSAGDEAIAEFRRAVREAHRGTLFRTGGDEFVLFSLGSRGDAETLARTILSAVGSCQVQNAPLSASVGIVLATDPREAPSAIIERADHEMYRAKERSRSETRLCVLAVEGAEPEVVHRRA